MECPSHLHIGTHYAIAEDDVVTGTATNRIAAFTALQKILAGAAENLVISFTAKHPVALLCAGSIIQMALLLIGIEHIIPGHAVDKVLAAAADDDITVLRLLLGIAPLLARQHKRTAVQKIGIIAAINPVAFITAEDRIIACAGLCDQGITRFTRF